MVTVPSLRWHRTTRHPTIYWSCFWTGFTDVGRAAHDGTPDQASQKGHHKVDTVPTSTVTTKFPLEFFHMMEDQMVILGMGEDVSPAAMGNLNSKPLTVIPPVMHVPTRLGSFPASLDDTWPENITTNATSARLWAFVSEGARVADTALQDFDRMVQDFRLPL
jgi:hypothetical protein